MSVYESDQKIGIELEIYCNDDVCGAREFIEYHNMSGFDVTDDGSLSCDGAEIKFDQGVALRDALPRIENMHRIATDGTSLDTYFGEGDDCGEQCYTGSSDADVRSMSGETGLHIHFGMADEFLALDLLRLIRNTSEDIRNIRKKAWRINERWAGSPIRHLTHIQNGIERALASTDMNDVNRTSFYLFDNKYTGVNLNNVGSDYMNTVEFRFGHSALMTDREAFDEYLATLKGHWDNSMTGEKEMVWGDMLLKEVTPASLTRRKAIRVFHKDTGEELGKFRIKFDN